MSSLSHVHVEVAIKDEFAAARRQIEALAQHASGPNLVASGLSRERVEGRLGLDLCRLVSRHGPRRRTDRMIFKIIAFLAAAIPIFLFVRSIFFRRTTRINEGLREFKKQANLAVSIFLFLIVCVVVFAAGKLAWTWWSSL
jgi:hypothetical protein